MKKNLFRMWRCGMAMLLVLCMVVGMCPVVGFAEEATGTPKKYVSLGDSMTNGYGMTGYAYNGYLQEVPQSYPALFAKEFNMELTPLAMSAMRAEDLHFILEFPWQDSAAVSFVEESRNWDEFDEAAWNAMFTTGDAYTWDEFVDSDRFNNPDYNNWSKGYGAGTANVARTYQEAVAAADVVSVGTGNSNIGVFLLGRIMNAVGFGGNSSQDAWIDLQNAIRECDADLQNQIMGYYSQLKAELSAADLPSELVDPLVNAIVYTMVSYVLNYGGVIEAIMNLNPDAEVIIVGLMNTLEGMQFTFGGKIYDLGQYMYGGLSILNAYLAALPTVLQAEGKYPEATFYYAEAGNVDVWVNNYSTEITTNEIILNRFITEIAGGYNSKGEWENGMVWGLMGDIVGGMIPGAELVDITIDDVRTYKAMDDVARATAAANGDIRNWAISCALYLAFEDATVESSHGATMSFEGLLALGNMSGDLFSDVIKNFGENIDTYGAAHIDGAATVVAAGSGGQLEAADVKALVLGGSDAVNHMAYTMVAAQTNVLNAEQLATLDSLGVEDFTFEMVAQQMTAAGVTMDAAAVKEAYEARNVIIVAYVEGAKPLLALAAEGIATAKDALNTAVDSANMLCMLLGMPEALSAALQSDEMIFGLLNMFARCLIGDGLGGHPSVAGHATLAEKVIASYAEKHTAQDQTMIKLGELYGLIQKYGPEVMEKTWETFVTDVYLDDDFRYVAIGDGSAESKSYVDYLAAELNEKAAEFDLEPIAVANYAEVGNTVGSEIRNLSDVSEADLVTVGFSNVAFLDDAIHGRVKMDWASIVGEEYVPQIEELMDQVKEKIEATEIPASLKVMANNLVEAYAFSAMQYAVELPKLIGNINAVNPEALVIIVGMSNPFKNITLALDENTTLDIGEYVDYLVSGVAVHGTACALMRDNTIYVDARDVPPIYAKSEITMMDIAQLGMAGLAKQLYPSEAGHVNIAENIMNMLNVLDGSVTVHIHTEETIPGKAPTCTEEGLTEGKKCTECGTITVNQEPIAAKGHHFVDGICDACGAVDETKITLWGDADGNGKIQTNDAKLILQYCAEMIGEDELDLTVIDVDGNGKIQTNDAKLILQYCAEMIDKFPA